MAEAIKPVFYEIVIAPEYEAAALELLKHKKDLRILVAELPPGYGKAEPSYLDFRRVKGGLLVQGSDSIPESNVRFTFRLAGSQTHKVKCHRTG